MTSAYVPEQNAKRINVNRVVIFATEQLWSHVYGRSDNRARHHGFRLAESEVGDLRSVPLVQEYIFQLDITMDKS